MFKESSLVTYYDEVIDFQVGTQNRVDFDFFKIWELKRKYKSISMLHFIHVHPRGFLMYSDLDEQVMKGYYKALGHSFFFSIVTFSNDNIHDLVCKSVTYMPVAYFKEVKIEKYSPYGIDIDDKSLAILKILSYGDLK